MLGVSDRALSLTVTGKRLDYSKLGIIAYVRFKRATKWSADDKGNKDRALSFTVTGK